jgi:hypothetical protein
MNRTLCAIVACLSVTLPGQDPACLASVEDPGQPPGFRFPAHPVYAPQSYLLPESTLSDFRRQENVAEIRAHGWQLLRAVTGPATSDSRIPVWLSWCTKEEILANPFACAPDYTDASKGRSYGSVGMLPSKAEVIDPKGFAQRVLDSAKNPHDGRPLDALVGSVHMDPNAARRFQLPALKQSAPLYRLGEWAPKVRADLAGVNGEDRRLDRFPRETIIVKPSWVVVRRDANAIRMQSIPVWNGRVPPQSTGPGDQTSVDPSRFAVDDRVDIVIPPDDPCKATPGPVPLKKANQRSLDSFFAVPICDSKLVCNINAVTRHVSDLPARLGDYLVLLGFHVITRELDEWVWSTFWWHDHPNLGEFAAGRPHSIARSVWGNYLMNITLGIDPGVRDIRPSHVFNPYLELGGPNGIYGDCFGCHQRAAAPLAPETQLPCMGLAITRLAGDSAVACTRVRTEFLWSIARGVACPNNTKCDCQDSQITCPKQ